MNVKSSYTWTLRRHQYQTVYGAEDETRGADASKLHGAASDARSLSDETVTDSRRRAEQGREASSNGHKCNLHGCEKAFVSSTTLAASQKRSLFEKAS